MAYKSYIPDRDQDFNAWLINFSTLITESPPTYGLAPSDAVSIAAVQASFTAALTLSTDPGTRTPATVAAKNAARVAAEDVVRPYAVMISQSGSVLPDDKVAVGVTLRIDSPTPIPAPNVAPELGIENAIPMQQRLTYKTPGTAGKYKPFGSIGVEIFRSVGEVFATDPEQCRYVSTVTKSPFLQAYDADEQGKKVTLFARYVTRSGPAGVAQAGPWSAPLNLTVM